MTKRTQRQEFEAWAKRQGYDVTRYVDCGDGQAFYSLSAQMTWEAWQAATRRANRRKRDE